MPNLVIQAENLGKKYTIGHQAENGRYTALRDVLMQNARGLWHKTRDLMQGKPIVQGDTLEEVWVLKDVSFEIRRGEAVGIIGRNGAGKTTLLKILSRITEPSAGRVTIKGRVASLLEVGTGFHPELTGRENIYLNGAILGMTRQEIKRKFDEIVAFAEVERYLDTPVKRYSSGMYVRLAFAVAAHLDPEILVVDEVLAVGDAEFQKRCLGKMQDVANKEGRTVLFVSHNMTTVNRLCRRCILLESGRVRADGDSYVVTAQYMVSDTGTMAERKWTNEHLRPGDEVARLIAVRVLQQGEVTDTVDIRHPIEVEMTYENRVEGARLIASLAFFDTQGIHLFATADFGDHKWASPRPLGVYRSVCRVPGNLFSEGIVRVVSEVSTRYPVYQIHFLVYDSVGFQVVDTGEAGSVRAGWGRSIPGVMRPMCEWWTSPHEASNGASKAESAERAGSKR